jgi:hypothetical protein
MFSLFLKVINLGTLKMSFLNLNTAGGVKSATDFGRM